MSQHTSSSLPSKVSTSTLLLWGTVLRSVALPCAGYVAHRCADYMRGASADHQLAAKRKQACYRAVVSSAADIGISIVCLPLQYLAAANTRRLMFDLALPAISWWVSCADRFDADVFIPFAFEALSLDPAAQHFDYFSWMIPSLVGDWEDRLATAEVRCRKKQDQAHAATRRSTMHRALVSVILHCRRSCAPRRCDCWARRGLCGGKVFQRYC